ncbi:MAG: hypothetical protein QM811_25585 [Pirellulales bacterium]
MARRFLVIGGKFLIVILGLGAVLATLFYMLASLLGPLSETTSVAAYEKTLKEWSGSGLVSHFPSNIPPHAQSVRFSAFSGYLQGGAHIQLRMKLPASEIAAIEACLKSETKHVYSGGDKYDHFNQNQQSNLPTTTFHTADNPKVTYAFPADYLLYVLSARNNGSWNHGRTSGAAISTINNEVIYWAEAW